MWAGRSQDSPRFIKNHQVAQALNHLVRYHAGMFPKNAKPLWLMLGIVGVLNIIFFNIIFNIKDTPVSPQHVAEGLRQGRLRWEASSLWLSQGLFYVIFCGIFGRLELAALASVPNVLLALILACWGHVTPPLLWICVAIHSAICCAYLVQSYALGRKPLWGSIVLAVCFYCEALLLGLIFFSSLPPLPLAAVGLQFSLLCWPCAWLIRRGFSLLTMGHNRRGFGPMTFRDLWAGLFTLNLFIFASTTLSSWVPIWKILPLSKLRKKWAIHWIMQKLCKFILDFHFTTIQRHIGLEHLDFSQPRLLMANHQSHIDLVMVLKLHPKIIVLTNEWVWNNPFYGTIVRYLDYIPAHLGLEQSLAAVQAKVQQGYSVLVFPEGTRTPHGKIQRFRQGAFQLAHALNLPIQPLLLHGVYDCMPKREFYLHPGQLSLKVFPVDSTPIEPDANGSFGSVAKLWTQRMRAWELELKAKLEASDYFSPALLRHYLYKGRGCYAKVKAELQREAHFEWAHEHLPLEGDIVVVGCGTGILAHHLKARSPARKILGLEANGQNLAIAQGTHIADRHVEFATVDLETWLPPPAEAYVFYHTWSALSVSRRRTLLQHFCKTGGAPGLILIREAENGLADIGAELVDGARQLQASVRRTTLHAQGQETLFVVSFTPDSPKPTLDSSAKADDREVFHASL